MAENMARDLNKLQKSFSQHPSHSLPFSTTPYPLSFFSADAPAPWPLLLAKRRHLCSTVLGVCVWRGGVCFHDFISKQLEKFPRGSRNRTPGRHLSAGENFGTDTHIINT